jgi:colicin import membrane protein
MYGRLLVVGAVVALVGCATGGRQATGEQTRQERLAQAQQRSEQALEQARVAQEQATQSEREAQRARERVTQARQELARAEQRLSQSLQEERQRTAEAVQAQQRAQQQAQQAQEVATQSQQRALELQRNRLTVTGEVAAVGPNLVIIRGAEPQPLRLTVSEDTQVLVGGQPSSVSELEPGSEVRVTYEIERGRQVAVRIEQLR